MGALQLRDETTSLIPEEPILQFFGFQHLPADLQVFSKPFGDLAAQVVRNLPRNPERTVALRKLLEAKDAAVRARIFKKVDRPPEATQP